MRGQRTHPKAGAHYSPVHNLEAFGSYLKPLLLRSIQNSKSHLSDTLISAKGFANMFLRQ
jgi:hypothetical protein